MNYQTFNQGGMEPLDRRMATCNNKIAGNFIKLIDLQIQIEEHIKSNQSIMSTLKANLAKVKLQLELKKAQVTIPRNESRMAS